MKNKRNFPWWLVIIVLGGLAILCVCCLGTGGLAIYGISDQTAFFKQLGIGGISPTATTWQLPQEVQAITEGPLPTLDIPALPQEEIVEQPPIVEELPPAIDTPIPTVEEVVEQTALTGNQRLDAFSLFDDFSSQALGWPIVDDEKSIMQYENGTYSIWIKESKLIDWEYIPVSFWPQAIRFDVYTLDANPHGSFGIYCQFQDVNNLYVVEFSLAERLFLVGEYVQGKRTYLNITEQGLEPWHKTNAIHYPPTDINSIYIECYPEDVRVTINDELVEEVSIPIVIEAPGRMAFFAYANSKAGPKGFKVFLDNMEVWQPVQ